MQDEMLSPISTFGDWSPLIGVRLSQTNKMSKVPAGSGQFLRPPHAPLKAIALWKCMAGCRRKLPREAFGVRSGHQGWSDVILLARSDSLAATCMCSW